MKKLFILTFIFMLLVSFVNATDNEGIYKSDTELIEASDFFNNDVVHVRDNYYAVAYRGTDNDGYLRIIELDSSNNVINSSVDLWEFDTNYAQFPKLVNYNSTSGLTVLGYLSLSGGGYQQITYRSFLVYSNGTILPTDVDISLVGASNVILGAFDMVQTGSDTFLGSGPNVYSSVTYLEYAGGTVASDGTLTLATQRRSACMDLITPVTYNFEKTGNTCTSFFGMSSGSEGRRYSVTCSDTTTSTGTFLTYSCSGTITPTLWESSTVNDLQVEHNTDSGYYILAYGETINNYPVIATIDESTLSVTDKIQIDTVTSSENAVHSLSNNTAFLGYLAGGDFYAKSYKINSGTGALTNQYNSDYNLTTSFVSFGDVPDSTDQFLMSYQSSSGSISTFGVGALPPPTPVDTSVTLLDESTLGSYDLTDKNLTFYAHCENNIDYQTTVNSTTQSIPVSCNYTSFSLKVEYQLDNITYSYKRYYLRDLTDTYGQFELDVYLIDPYTTEYVQNEIVVDDLTDEFVNAKLYFEKNINGVTTQITAAEIDLTNSMRAILINGDTYYVSMENDAGDIIDLGILVAPPSGIGIESTTISIYDIKLKVDPEKISEKIEYYVYSKDNQMDYLVRSIEDVDPNLINVTLEVFNGTLDSGTLIYNVTRGGAYNASDLSNLFADTGINLSAYENNTVSFEMNIYFYDKEIKRVRYTGYLWENNKIDIPILNHINQSWMNWFFIILLSVVAIYATSKTADITAFVILLIAGVFIMFGWFELTYGALGFAIMIALLNLIRKGAE